MDIQERLIEQLARIVGHRPTDVIMSRAPGRVEVLGNHTDYNGGAVLSATIERYVWSVGAQNERVVVYSTNYDKTQTFEPTEIGPVDRLNWHTYLRGVYWAYHQRGLRPPAVAAVVSGDVPIGAGLSSSAALEVSFANLLNESMGTRLVPRDVALVAYEAERNYCGVACGIMDQFTSQLCQPHSILSIDCTTLETENIPLSPDICIMIIDSMVSRAAGDILNKRRKECIEAVQILVQNGWRISKLTDIPPERIPQAEALLDSTHAKRMMHVVIENARVIRAKELLRENNLQDFGRVMNLSHISSRELYEVSHPRLDLLVEITGRQQGVIGSRLTGAGLGGAILALVKRRDLTLVGQAVSKEYERETGEIPRIITSEIPGGAATWRI